ncbi:hypothetical protein CRG98_021253 [Punica granatum]|uniref:Uncharacterized protein n=1 Tax=Punica granatum TaxID=22663 RepID=A0A2I0JQ00_PUNGR|nr:hypothetical protein CRG98_021253 [Punica granatum]
MKKQPDCLVGSKFLTVCAVFLQIGSIRGLFGQTTTTITSEGETISVDPITLGANDHHDHLEGSLGYLGLLTLPQNSIGSLRGGVRPDLCQSGLFSVLAGSVCAFRHVEKYLDRSREKHPNPGKASELKGLPPREVTEYSLALFEQGTIFLTRYKFNFRASSCFLTRMKSVLFY